MGKGREDSSGAVVAVPARPERIISLVPSVSETLFSLGLGHRVVGVTDWCIHPGNELARVPRVRGTKNPDVEKIGTLAPDLVLANLEENREIDVRRLREKDLCVWVDFPCTVPDVVEHVRFLAGLGAPPGASHLADSIERAMATRADAAQERKRRCFLAVWKDPWMTVSAATYAHDLLARLGLENVFADAPERYPRVTLDEIAAREPDVVLLPDEPYAFTGAEAEETARSLAGTPAGQTGSVHVVDGTLAFWHGPRTARALNEGLVPRSR